MLNLVVIRTGESEYDGQGRIQGALDVPLSADGLRQVEQAAQQIHRADISPSALYAGPCRSVQQSAEILGQAFQLKPKTIDRLSNIDHGLWQGMLVDEVKAKQPKVYKKWRESPDSVCPPEGETMHQVRGRLQKVLGKLQKKHKSGAIALVLPRPLATVMKSLIRREAIGDLWCDPSEGTPLWELIEAVSSPRADA